VVYRYGDAVKREEKEKKKDRRNVCDEQQGRRAAEVAPIPLSLPQNPRRRAQATCRKSESRLYGTGSG